MRAPAIALAVITAAVMALGQPAAAACTPGSGLGLSRVVEIDTRSGPLFGHHTGYQRAAKFLQPKEVVLTFDDGPMPWITKSILDTLDNHCTKATFFSIGRMAIAYPQTTREILTRGHTLGTHTWSHPLNLKRLKPDSAIEEIERGFAAVALAAGQPIAPFFRFPGLNDNAALLTHLQSRGVGTFTVDAISNDSYIVDATQLIAHTLAQVEASQGGIILFHDIKATTARALPVILAELQAKGYKVVHIRAATAFEPQPQYAAQLAPLLAKAQPVGKGNLVPFYGPALRPGIDVPGSSEVPVTTIVPEAKAYVARANETGFAKASLKKPMVRAAAVQPKPATRLASAPSPAPSRLQQPQSRVSREAPAPGGLFSFFSSGWVTTVAPPPRLRRGAVD
jgi:peptidoglycan-N-acetylglucosamine deacetylase